MTNPDNALGTNGAFGGRTSVNAFNDVLATFAGAGIVSGFVVEPDTGMTVAVGGDGTTRDVAVAEDPFGNRTTVDNISGDPIPVTIDTASTTTARIDSIVAYVNSPANASDTSVDNPTACGIISVNGTSGGAPTDAAIRTAITTDGGTGSTAYYVVIANVSVPANTTTITSGLISAGQSINLTNVATTGSNGLMSGADKSKLDNLEPTIPTDYVEINAIQNLHTAAYINTGFTPNQNTRVVMGCSITTSEGVWCFGARQGTNNSTFSLLLESSNKIRSDYNTTVPTASSTSAAIGAYQIIDKNKNVTTIGAGATSTTVTATAGTFDSGCPLYLFTTNTNGSTASANGDLTIFWCRIYDNGTLVRNLVPVIKKLDGSVGFYDTVGRTFYQQGGTGTLIGL